MRQYEITEGMRQLYKQEIVQKVRQFHFHYNVSKAALYNYALSLLNIEYYKLGKEDREEVLKQYL